MNPSISWASRVYKIWQVFSFFVYWRRWNEDMFVKAADQKFISIPTYTALTQLCIAFILLVKHNYEKLPQLVPLNLVSLYFLEAITNNLLFSQKSLANHFSLVFVHLFQTYQMSQLLSALILLTKRFSKFKMQVAVSFINQPPGFCCCHQKFLQLRSQHLKLALSSKIWHCCCQRLILEFVLCLKKLL